MSELGEQRTSGWGQCFELPGGVVVDWRCDPNAHIAFGSFATRSEKALVWLGALALCAWTAWQAAGLDWSWWQWVVVMFLAFDLGGGAIANSLNSAKQFYHSPALPSDSMLSRLARRPLFFASLHVHTIVAAAVLQPQSLPVALLWYLAMMACAALLLSIPISLRRPAAALMLAASIVVTTRYVFLDVALCWMPSVLCVKILCGHLLREEPYKRATRTGPEIRTASPGC